MANIIKISRQSNTVNIRRVQRTFNIQHVGRPGPRGLFGQDKYFEQAFTNLSSVVVNHELNKKPSVTVINSAGDQVIGEVEYHGLNSLTLTFSSSFSGTVVCN
jgi:hypothetical protein